MRLRAVFANDTAATAVSSCQRLTALLLNRPGFVGGPTD
jgi:hypothetical protein